MGTPQKRDLEDNGSKLERSKYVYELVNDWIENADNKVGISCGIFTGVFGVFAYLSGRIVPTSLVIEFWKVAYRWSFAISLVTMLVSILFYVLAINPNLGKSGKKGNGVIPRKKYPVFYGDIAETTVEDYKKLMNKATDTDYIDELQNEIHYNSLICKSKMRFYKIGLWLSFAAVIIAGFSWVSRFFMYS